VKERWQQLSAKFNALTLRERLTILAGLIVVTALLFQFFVLDPQQLQKRRLILQIKDARTNIQASENALKAQDLQSDPETVKRAYLEALRKQVEEIDKNMQGLQKGLVPPDQMAKLLEGMLARNRGLQLVSLRKLPVQRFESQAQAAAAKLEPSKPQESKPGSAASRDTNIYQHSFELTVQGSYADLYDYLVRLEKLPWRMFWGKITLDTEQSPKLTLTLTVHTLSFSKAWLIV
jgi:MSHA biogenesis protein MshJ